MDYSAHYEKTPRMWSQGLHAHDFYEIYIHLSGGRYYCVDNRIYELKPGQLLIIPPLHMHGLVCDRDLVDYERCYLYLSPETVSKCDPGRINLPGLLDSSADAQKNLFSLSETEADVCKRTIRRTEQLSESDARRKQFEIYAGIFQILQIVCDKLETSEIVLPQKASDNPIIQILHYVNEHFTQNITRESISREFHISESTLSHQFRKYVNKGVYEYILYRRIILAKELMHRDRSLTEIAFMCGFSDYSNFLRVFTKQTGMSPKDYRDRQ